MRKRILDRDSQTDSAEHCHGSKRRHKAKLSDKFVRELQNWANTVDDVKRLYDDVVNRRLGYTESPTESSLQVISSGRISPTILHRNTLPLSLSQTPASVSSPAASEVHNSSVKKLCYTESFNRASTPPVLNGTRFPVALNKDRLPQSAAGVCSPASFREQDSPIKKLCYTESLNEMSTPPSSCGTTSPVTVEEDCLPMSVQQSLANVKSPTAFKVQNSPTNKVCYTENRNKVFTLPIPSSTNSTVNQEEEPLPWSAPQAPASLSSPASSKVQDSLIRKLGYTERASEVSTPPISCRAVAAVNLEEEPLPRSAPQAPASLSSPASSKGQDSLIRKLGYTERASEASTPPTSCRAVATVNLEEEPLPRSAPQAPAGLSSPASSEMQDSLIRKLGYTERASKVSTPPISCRAVATGNLEEDPLLVSVPRAPASVKSPAVSKVQDSLCYTQDFRKFSAPPISSCPTMLQTPKGVNSSAASRDKATSEEAKLDLSGIKDVHIKGTHKVPFPDSGDGIRTPSQCHEPPSEACHDSEAMKRLKTQNESLSRLPSSKTPVVEVSHIVSFLQRLIKCGVQIDLKKAPGYKKDSMASHQGAHTQRNGADDLKELKSKQYDTNCLPFSKNEEDLRDTELERFSKRAVLATKSREGVKGLESEKPSMASLVFNVSKDIAKESREPDTEKNRSFLSSRGDDNAAGLKETERDKEVAAEITSFLVSRMEQLASESDDGDGDLKHLWDDMEFSLACMNESRRDKAHPDSNKKDGCNHDFFKKDDVGLVCSLCGLVGEDTEHIFNYIWGEASRKRRSGNHGTAEKCNAGPAEEEPSEGAESPPAQQTQPVLVLHPQYRDKVRVHQEEGIQFLQRSLIQDKPNGCILAHAPGTGKSFLIIAFLQSFQASFPDERPLIIAPNGMLSVWVREFQKWKVEDTRIFNLYEALSLQELDDSDNDNGALSQRRHGQLEMLQQWKAHKSVLLVGYPTFSRLISGSDASLFPEIRSLLLEVPGLLIMDEGHFPRNKDTQILKSLSQVRTRRRVLLTGTLFQNNFYELYNLYHLVRPDFMSLNASCTKHILEDYMKSNTASPGKMRFSPSPRGSKPRSRKEDMELRLFENLGEIIRSTGDVEKKRQAISQLRELSKPFVHWYKGQVLEELPGLVDLTLFLKMTQIQEEMLLSLQAKVENQLDRSIKSMKVCIHPSLVADAAHTSESSWKHVHVDASSSSKVMFVLDLLRLAERLQEKVLLFSQLLDPFYLLEGILKRARGWRLNREILKIEGQTSLEERESVIDRFNENPKSRILFASIKTCGEGVSLIGASRIVLLDVQWNPMVSRQAISRAFRIGQKRKVYVYRLVGQGAMEEHTHETASEKEWLAKQVIEGCSDEDYDAYCREVDPQTVDAYFESLNLRENVIKCLRYHFV